MHVSSVLMALAGLSSLATAAPATVDRRTSIKRHVVGRPLKATKNNGGNSSNGNSGNTIVIEQTIIEPTVVIVQENLNLVTELALIAEQEFSALVQAQLALVQEIGIIKNNIRVNHFFAKFSEVNTVIIVITEVVDVRSKGGSNTRYMVNQQLANHKGSQSTVVVMMTAASPMTIGLPTASLNLSALPSGFSASVVSDAAARTTADAASAAANTAAFSNTTVGSSKSKGNSSSSGQVTSFDPSNPFGKFNQSIILPYGSKAPSLPNGAQIVSDPAAIILPNQGSLLVEDVNRFSQDCAVLESTQTLFTLQSAELQAEQIAAQLLSGLSLGKSSSLNAAAAALLGIADAISAPDVASVTSSSRVIVSATAAASSTTTSVSTPAVATSTALPTATA
ncbi:hypothetical protein CMQ_7116 [Grosmannia clavigera kw1407]|uniref:Uncharacterized protein n=1 Tax=Grosmannia clavigera (strain kw1407 / UAMH 11150) TaxID=655863 RepID=F0XPL2_GROCL|nr:uncharacterized protein CMQ_7116 [Grosmannia clavigera kw1407]EFX00114.1 hypothetical protein CMQ_7116 [Grosmannia clavigera kw1407]